MTIRDEKRGSFAAALASADTIGMMPAFAHHHAGIGWHRYSFGRTIDLERRHA